MRTFASLLSGIALSAVLAGCATTEAQLHTRETTRIADDLNAIAGSPAAPADVSSVQVRPTTYVGANVARNLNGDPLPTKWESQNVQFARGGSATFQDVAAMLTQSTGIPVAVSTAGMGDIAATNAVQGTVPVQRAATGSAPGQLAAGPLPADFPIEQALAEIQGSQDFTVAAAVASGTSHEISGTMRLNYSGKLRGFLDLVAANFNIGWEYRNGRILFSKTVTRIFDVPALPIIANLSFSMSSNSTLGDGDASAAGQKASTEGGFDLWTDLSSTLEGIVAGTGIFKMSSQTGQVVVVAPPSTVDRVSDYMRQLNAQLNKQVAISVKVYSVALDDGDQYSSDIGSLVANVGNVGLNLVGSGAVSGSSGLGWAVVGGDASGNGFVQALSSRGDVSTVTSASVTALNGVPVPVQVANTQGYAKSVSVSVSDGTVTGSVEPGEITTGFNLHLVPKILGNGSLLLQYGMNISELNNLESFEVPGGGNIQLPNVTQRNFIQQAQIPNGATLVLAGFEQVRSETRANGPVHAGLWPFGGGRQSSMGRELIVIAITPTVMDLTPAAQAAYAQ